MINQRKAAVKKLEFTSNVMDFAREAYARKGGVTVAELCTLASVSRETARRALVQLEIDGGFSGYATAMNGSARMFKRKVDLDAWLATVKHTTGKPFRRRTDVDDRETLLDVAMRIIARCPSGINVSDLMDEARCSASRSHAVIQAMADHGFHICRPNHQGFGGLRAFRTLDEKTAWVAWSETEFEARQKKSAPRQEEPPEPIDMSRMPARGGINRMADPLPVVPGWGRPPPIRAGAMDYKRHMSITGTRVALTEIDRSGGREW